MPIHGYNAAMDEWHWWLTLAVFAVGAYLCGSIPFGLLIGRAQGVDIRRHGSCNIGATNCGRVLGRKWGLICFVLDVAKGTAPVLIAGWWFGWIDGAVIGGIDAWTWLALAVLTVMGHVLPVWLSFRGGKGVATGLGALLGVWPYLTLPAVGAAMTWLLFASMIRYVSWASVIAAISLPAWLMLGAHVGGWSWSTVGPMLLVCGLMVLLVIVRHRQNLVRLAEGTESRLGEP
jgi:glycerol-3-phosphate acyltransferase PlsY